MEKNPLVSIVIITYNSSQYVLDTLESAKNQSYHNIELIVTDDCSTDDTVGICRDWLDKNSSHFIQTEIITSLRNTGISANCNRGYRRAHGEWIKGLAADDILMPDAISNYVKFVNENIDAQIVFAQAIYFREERGITQYDSIIPKQEDIGIYDKLPQEQFKELLKNNIVVAPTGFIKTNLFEKYEFDERYKYLDDYPMWLRLTFNGVKLYFMKSITVQYRLSETSVSRGEKKLFPQKLYESLTIFYYLEKQCYLRNYAPELIDNNMKDLLLYNMSNLFFHNKSNVLTRGLLKILRAFVNVFHFES